MDFNEIKRLVKLVETSNISEIEIDEMGSRLRIIKNAPPTAVFAPQPQYAAVPTPPPSPVVHEVVASSAPAAAAPKAASKLMDIVSPMVGTFYRAPSPEAPPYINIGDNVRVGQVLCIVEAMKLMNEIEAEVSGRVVEILAENAHPVEFGQVIFRIDPNA